MFTVNVLGYPSPLIISSCKLPTISINLWNNLLLPLYWTSLTQGYGCITLQTRTPILMCYLCVDGSHLIQLHNNTLKVFYMSVLLLCTHLFISPRFIIPLKTYYCLCSKNFGFFISPVKSFLWISSFVLIVGIIQHIYVWVFVCVVVWVGLNTTIYILNWKLSHFCYSTNNSFIISVLCMIL